MLKAVVTRRRMGKKDGAGKRLAPARARRKWVSQGSRTAVVTGLHYGALAADDRLNGINLSETR